MNKYPEAFIEYWLTTAKRHGKRLGKPNTFNQWLKVLKDGAEPEDLLKASIAYTRYCEENDTLAKDPERFLKHGFWESFLEDEDDTPQEMVSVDAQQAAAYYQSIDRQNIAEKCLSDRPPQWALIVPKAWLESQS